MQVKHGDVVQVSLIIISFNSSTHLGRYTLTASNAAGTAAESVTVRLAPLSPSTAPSSHSDASTQTDNDDDDDDDGGLTAAVIQRPDGGYSYYQITSSRLPSNLGLMHRILSSLIILF